MWNFRSPSWLFKEKGGNILRGWFSKKTWLQMVEGKVEVAYKQVAVVEHFFNIIYRWRIYPDLWPIYKRVEKIFECLISQRARWVSGWDPVARESRKTLRTEENLPGGEFFLLGISFEIHFAFCIKLVHIRSKTGIGSYASWRARRHHCSIVKRLVFWTSSVTLF